MQPRVIVLSPPKVNIFAATEFGEMVVLFRPHHVPNPLDTNRLVAEVIQRLEKIKYNPAEDHIVVAGVLNVFSVALPAIAIRYNRFKALIYNKGLARYESRELGTHPWEYVQSSVRTPH
jgi:hypothetical protein